MANVSLDVRCRPTVEITIIGPRGETTLTAVIDTGFDGFLSVPSRELNLIGLPDPAAPKVTTKFSLADNSSVIAELCQITARLDGEEEFGLCVIAPQDGEALLGVMALMNFKKRLTLDIINDEVSLVPTAYDRGGNPG